ncbi:unnamed protein product, partial [Nesidiocoris tenuis]
MSSSDWRRNHDSLPVQRAVQSREGGGVISSYDTMTTLGEMLNKIKIAKNVSLVEIYKSRISRLLPQ